MLLTIPETRNNMKWPCLEYIRLLYIKPYSLFQVSKLEIHKCYLGDSSNSLWVSLASLTSLNLLNIKSSSLALPHQSPPPLASVTKLDADNLTPESYWGLIRSLPGLKTMGIIRLSNPDTDIVQIYSGLHHTKASITQIWLDVSNKAQRSTRVSDSSMGKLCDAIRFRMKNLHDIELWNLTINEESLVSLVEACRASSTVMKITWVKLGNYKWVYINSSQKVWKSEFDRLFLPSLSNNRCMFDTIRKTI